MKVKNVFNPSVLIATLLCGAVLPALAQVGPELQMAELSRKLQLTEQQKKELAPVVEQRDKEIKALKAETSMGELQNFVRLRKYRPIFETKRPGF